jgi:hypothetical protein
MTTFDETGQEWFTWDFKVKFKVPWDPNNPVMVLCAPPGGVGHANFPAMVQGDNGLTPLLQEDAEVTELEWDDATPVSSQWVMVSPGTPGVVPPLYKEVKTIRKGEPGTDGASVLNPTSFGTPVYKRLLQVNAATTGFEYTPQKVGGLHWPVGAAAAAPVGTTAGFTVHSISIPANTYPFDWRPGSVEGSTIVTGSSADVVVDLVARLNTTSGPVVGRCPGLGGITDRLILAGGPDGAALSADVTVAANAAAVLYLRTEKQGGAATYQSSAAATRFSFIAVPVP